MKPARFFCLLFLALLAAAPALAGCTAKDSWRGPDKIEHFALGAGVGMASTLANDGDFWTGVKWASAVAVGKEALDATGLGTCTLQDAVTTIVGGVVGASLGVGLSVMRERDKTTVTVSMKF